MKNFQEELMHFLRHNGGASAAEYALILAIIGGGLAVAALALGNSIGISMNTTASCINAPSSC